MERNADFARLALSALSLAIRKRGLGLPPLSDLRAQGLVDGAKLGGALYHGALHFPLAQDGGDHALRQHRGERQHQQRRACRRIKPGQRGTVPRRAQHQEERLAGHRERHLLMEFGIAKPAFETCGFARLAVKKHRRFGRIAISDARLYRGARTDRIRDHAIQLQNTQDIAFRTFRHLLGRQFAPVRRLKPVGWWPVERERHQHDGRLGAINQGLGDRFRRGLPAAPARFGHQLGIGLVGRQIHSDQIAAAFERLDIGDRKIGGPRAGIDQAVLLGELAQPQSIKPIALEIGLKSLALLLADLRQPQHRLEAGILRQDLMRESGKFPAVDIMRSRNKCMDRRQRGHMPLHIAFEGAAIVGGVALELLPVGAEIIAAQYQEDRNRQDESGNRQRAHGQKIRQPLSISVSDARHIPRPAFLLQRPPRG